MITTAPKLQIKICCIQSIAELELAVEAGATAAGLVSAMPSGPGPISEDVIAEIIAAAPSKIMTVLLTSQTELAALEDQLQRLKPRAVQLVDRVQPDRLIALKEAFPDTALIDVIHVRSDADVVDGIERSKAADILLLDSGAPEKTVKELGGTGRVHDWSLSRQIVEGAACPVWLAGGLNPENLANAVAAVRPAGVDVCSGLRPKGKLEPDLLRRFVREVRC